MSERRAKGHDRAERETGQLRPREMERRPERTEYREVSKNREIEARFRDKVDRSRLLGLPRVEGFEKSGAMSNKEVREYLKNDFPEKHANNITMESIRYNDRMVPAGKGVEQGHWDKREVAPDTNVYNREIVVNQQSFRGNMDGTAMRETIAHEVGHQVHLGYMEKGDQQEWLRISGERPKDKCVSAYACSDYREDFAESYQHYVQNPELLKSVNPDKYNFMRDKVFEGREYDRKKEG